MIFAEGYRHHCRVAFSEPLCNYICGPVLCPRLGQHLKFPGRPVSQPPSHWYVAGLLSRLTAGKDRAMTPLFSEATKSRFILFSSEVETCPGVNDYAWLYHSSCVLTRQTCRRTAHCGRSRTKYYSVMLWSWKELWRHNIGVNAGASGRASC
jgi:hypothetical protein